MRMADPSECVESSGIVPALRRHFQVIEEKPIGGNILFLLLKDIAHHFLKTNAESQRVLESLFQFEDEWLADKKSDFLFGVYQKR
jgi:hypothetical protein